MFFLNLVQIILWMINIFWSQKYELGSYSNSGADELWSMLISLKIFQYILGWILGRNKNMLFHIFSPNLLAFEFE